MTLLQKPIRRELPQTFDRRQWVISIEPWGLQFRAKRSRTEAQTFPIEWEAVWSKAVQIAVERRRKEKKEQRRGGRKNHGRINRITSQIGGRDS